MRFFSLLAIAALLGTLSGMAATSTKTTAAKKVSSSKSTPKSGPAKSGTTKSTKTASSKTSPTKAGTKARTKAGTKNAKAAPAPTWRNRQQAPTADRYRQIQQALVDKGYLKSEPSGVWDADSTDAMQRFQSDQQLPPTGKITSASLIGLGLGGKSAGAPEAAPLPGSSPPASGVPPAETPQPAKTSDN